MWKDERHVSKEGVEAAYGKVSGGKIVRWADIKDQRERREMESLAGCHEELWLIFHSIPKGHYIHTHARP